jgi:hypothetical protein
MIQFDHLRLVRRQPTEVARFRRYLLSAAPRELSELAIVHENDGRCCRLEKWDETAARIIDAVNPTTSLMLVQWNSPEAV